MFFKSPATPGRQSYTPLQGQFSGRPDGAGSSSGTPTLEAFGGNIKGFIKALKKHSNYDLATLYDHVKNLPEAEQTAVIDNSKSFREFLGIRDPERRSEQARKILNLTSPSSSSPHIHDDEAPAALAMTATRSGDKDRVMRSLKLLKEKLNKREIQSNEIAGRTFTQLIQGLETLPSTEALQEAAHILENHGVLPNKRPNLEHRVLTTLATFAADYKDRLGINSDLKESLTNLYRSAMGWAQQDASRANERDQERLRRLVHERKNQG